MRDGAAYDRQLRARTRAAAAGSTAAAAPATAAAPAEGPVPAEAEADAAAAAPVAADDYDDDAGGTWDCGGSDGDGIDLDDGLAPPLGPVAADGVVFEGEGAFLPDDAFAPVDDVPAPADAEPAAGQEAGGGAAVRQRRGAAGGDGVVRRGGADAEPFDPYRPLDPNDKGGLLIKPLQVRAGGGRPGWRLGRARSNMPRCLHC